MKYRIEVSEVQPRKDGETYERERTLFSQVVDNLDVHDLAVHINEPLRYHEVEKSEDLHEQKTTPYYRSKELQPIQTVITN